jgi:hypothetical protein
MRARAKFVLLPLKIHPMTYDKPDGMSDEEWTKEKVSYQKYMEKMEQERANYFYGKPLPFTTTPKGTTAFKWSSINRQNTYETDLPPLNDEAGVIVCAIFRPESQPIHEGANGENVRWSKDVYVQIGGTPVYDIRHTNYRSDGSIRINLAMKFWIIADNLDKEVSRIYHVEIPDSYENIICTPVSKEKDKSKYEEFDKLLSA